MKYLTTCLIVAVLLWSCSKSKKEITYSTVFSKSFLTPTGQKGNWYYIVQLADRVPTSNKYIRIYFPDQAETHGKIKFLFTSPGDSFTVEMPAKEKDKLFFIQPYFVGEPYLIAVVEN